jgi:phosphoglycolate phosphatase-like HAD superfamily hydrolase
VLALIFDLDGTLVDTVYAHVFAWQRALDGAGMPIDGWRIHRRIGMSGGLFARAVAREVGRPLSLEEAEEIQQRHGAIFRELLPGRRPLPGAVDLLADLRAAGVVHGIATSGRTSRARSPSRISSSRAPSGWASSRASATWSATRCGISSPHGARECSASAC